MSHSVISRFHSFARDFVFLSVDIDKCCQVLLDGCPWQPASTKVSKLKFLGRWNENVPQDNSEK